ncbi:uncharacterized protein LOC120353054 isoform X2 [Nilaparvata lugens]|uniref:uncharacterized protein LOC120353054 isoform X2 n=1 Tax=Nilaparvata lugens TaxID=108931 RepID=UPI00193DC366|nr:uncharacterized protein LOC120353054 isoform X2 [Nilaparvata lugens]
MMKVDDFNKRVNFAVTFIVVGLATFFAYHNGQRVFNQNDTLRRALAELPWTDKPEWLKKNLHIMMTRANVDIEMRPFGVYTLNYMSFKDVMKTAYSFGNILYTKKLSIQTQY